MIRLTARLQEEYENAMRRYICRHEVVEGETKSPTDRDHDHITGWFIGTVHRHCILERPVSFNTPLFFHNFHGYDAHLIVHKFGKQPDCDIKVIGQNMEKYLHVEWGKNMVFRESLKFLTAFQEQLAESLPKVGRGLFKTLHDVVTNVYPEAKV